MNAVVNPSNGIGENYPMQAIETPCKPCKPRIGQGARLALNPKCGAKTRSGGLCRAPAMANGRCRLHGGKTPRGLASPHTKTGLYSPYMEPLFREKHEGDLQAKEEIKKLDEDIVLLHGMICRALEKIHTGERGTVWDDLQVLVMDAEQDNATLETILPRLQDLAARGKETAQAERDIIGLIHDKAKITAIQRKAEADAGQLCSYDTVKATLGRLVLVFRDSVGAHVGEQTARAIMDTMQRDLTIVLQGPDSPRAIPQE
jgi:hypothetical protein